jgi:DNA-binding NarL/FixJ family response regulator
MTRLLILDNCQVFAECLSMALTGSGVSVIGWSDSHEDAVKKVRETETNLLLINIRLQKDSSLELLHSIVTKFPNAKVIMFGLNESEIVTCVEAGAHGYLTNNASLDDLIKSIDRVVNGGALCSPDIAFSMFSRLADLAVEWRWRERVACLDLTFRQIEVLRLISIGLTNKEIADRLCVSVPTVKNHIHNVLQKLKVKDRSKAVEYARQKGWISD